MCEPTISRWLKVALIISGIHSIVWGIGMILLPEPAARAWGLADVPHDVFLWQGTGLVILLFGTGYLIASTDPWRHWAVVLIGLLAKILGPIGVLIAAGRGEVPSDVLWLLPVNDVIWWIPFAIVVRQGSRRRLMPTPP